MTKFNPFDYDIYHIGVSGGKDSTAALLWLIFCSGWPLSRVRATFCDTNNEDYYTYAYLAMLTERVFPIEYIFPDLDFWELAKKKKRFPSRKARFCTQLLKIVPSRDHILRYQQKGLKVLLLNGERKDEGHSSNDRVSLEKFDFDEGFACDIFRPIVDWSIDNVWEIHSRFLEIDDVLTLVENDPHIDKASKLFYQGIDLKTELADRIKGHGIPRNPLYDIGASRVGCFPCINSAKAEIRAMAKYRPERIEFLSEKEHDVGANRSNVGYSSIFARKTVPVEHRTKEITTTKGEIMKVATIHDVVEWSKTAYGGKQYDMDFGELPACRLGGYCE